MRDVISGFFLILEDQVRVGDVAVVNGQGGLVEAVNLRTIVLRDEEGTVHVFPNGEVKTLANKSKDFAYYVITHRRARTTRIPIAWRRRCKDAADTLIADPEFRTHILEPLEVYGVDAFEADAARGEGADQDRAAEAVDGRTRAAEADCEDAPRARNPDAGRAGDSVGGSPQNS